MALEDEGQQPPEDDNPYRALIRQERDGADGALRDVGRQAAQVAPDTRAEHLKLATKFGLPLDMVERNPDAFKQRQVEELPEERRLLRNTPKLAEWLTQSDAAPAAADDLPKLQELDNRLTFGATILRGVDDAQKLWGHTLQWAGDVVGSERLERYGGEVAAFNEAQSAALGYRSPQGWTVQYAKELAGGQIPIMAPIVAGGTAGAAIGSVVPGVGTAIGAAIGAAIPALTLGLGEVQGVVKELDPEGSAPALVFLGGSAIAALDVVMPVGIGRRLAMTFGRETAEAIVKRALSAPVAPRFLRGVAGQGAQEMATEGLTEALQEAIAQVTGSVATGTAVDYRQLGRQMLEAGIAGAIVGGGMSAGATAIAHPRERARFAAAQQQQAFFEALGGTLKDSKLLARLPAGAREFVAQATKDGPVETVYAPIDTFVEYWQQQGVDPAVMAAELTGRPDALEQARATGADLAIPLADYAVKIAATDHNAFFAKELRLDPRMLNARESAALQEQFAQAQAGVQEPDTREPADEVDEFQKGAAEVGRRIFAQARAAGESDQVATAWSQLYETAYGSVGRRFKRNPVALFEQRPLAIQRDDGAVFTPAAPGARVEVDIPASEATPGETPAQRSTRREAHFAALTSSYVRDARALDPHVDPALLRAEIEQRLEMAEAVRADQAESGSGQDLLRAIAGYGGLDWEASGQGELSHYAVEGVDQRRRGARGALQGRKTWNGIPSVFRAGGLTADGMREALSQDPRWANVTGDINELMDALDAAMRATPDAVDAFPGTEELQALGIVPGTTWWTDRWAEPAEQVGSNLDGVETDAGDVSFNPAEFEQRPAGQPRLRDVMARPDDPANPLANMVEAQGRVQAFSAALKAATPALERLDLAMSGDGSIYLELIIVAQGERNAGVGSAVLRTILAYADVEGVTVSLNPAQKGDPGGTTSASRLRAFYKRLGFVENKGRTSDPSIDARMYRRPQGELYQRGGEVIVPPAPAAPAETSAEGPRAVFQSWWDPGMEGEPAIALFDVELEPGQVSTVTREKLAELGIAEPADMPDQATWAAQQTGRLKEARRKLRRTRTAADVRTHSRAPELYQVDLFGHTVTMPRFATRTELVPTGERQLGASTITRPAEAAAAAAYLAKGAVERFDAIVTDATGTPLAIVGSFKGRVDAASVFADVVIGEAIRVEGAAHIWFAHNHPSGSPSLSDADRQVVARLHDRFRDTGIQPHGILAMGARGESFEWYEPAGTGEIGSDYQQGMVPTVGQRPRTVPIVEREFAATAKLGDAIRSPAAALREVPLLAQGEFGAVLLDAQHTPIAFVPIAPEEAGALREGGHLAALLTNVSIAGAASAFVYVPGAGDIAGMNAAHNLANALHKHDVSVLDIVLHQSSGAVTSARTYGGGGDLALSGEFYQADAVAVGGMFSRILASVAQSQQPVATGAEWKATIRNSKLGVNLDEYSAIGVDTLEDGRRYTKADLLADLEAHQVQVEVVTLADPVVTDEQIRQRTEELYAQEVDAQIDYRLESGSDPAEGLGEAEARYNEVEEQWEALVGGADVGVWYDTEEAAREVAEAEHQKRSDQAWASFRTDVANEIDHFAVQERVEAELREEHEDRAPQHREYVEPGGDEGSYREVFLTAPKARGAKKAIRLSALTAEDEAHLTGPGGWGGHVKLLKEHLRKGEVDAARALVTRLAVTAHKHLLSFEVHNVHNAHDLEIATRSRTILAKLDAELTWQVEEQPSTWHDGHAAYGSIVNPIVRLRSNARTSADGTTTMFLEEVQPPQKDDDSIVPPIFQKHWRELAMKWAVRHAAVNGFDRIAWTPGAVQVRRYSLARHLDRLDYYPQSRQLAGYDPEGGELVRAHDVAPEDVGTHVGAELGARLLAAPVEENAAGTSGRHTLRDLTDIQLGGEGLARLYDRDLPAVLGKLPAVKKAGSKVGPVSVRFGRVPQPVPEPMHDASASDQRAWFAAHPNVDDVREVPGLVITESIRQQVAGGQALFQPEGGGIKGAFNPNTNTLRLVSGKADLSTFLHESGHFFLELLADIAVTVDPATEVLEEQQLLGDLRTVLTEAGFQGTLEAWRALPVDARRDVHEHFARSFEQYLSDGHAPSPALRQLFARFRDWIVAVYRSAQGLGIEVSPELRGVFDRLLASDDAIAEVEAESRVLPLFTDPASAGVDPLTFEAYRSTVAAASQAAREDVDRQLMTEWRRERTAWWKAEREPVRAAVEAEVHAQPVYQALSVMRTGTLLDGSIPYDGQPLKLSKRSLQAEFGRDTMQALARKRPVVYSVEGGIRADTAAELFGFATGQALVDAIVAAPPMRQVIEQEADRRMRAKHGDMLLDGMALRDVAEGAVHEHRAAVISAELDALTRGMAGASIPPAATLRRQAEEAIRRVPVRALKPGQYLQASRRAAQRAFELLGANDRRGAVAAKQQELVALAHWRAARTAKERADSIRDRLLKFANTKALRARIGKAGQDYLDQIDGFLERYEFARVSQKAMDRRRSLRQFVAQLEADGLPVEMPEDVLDDSRRVNWQELPLEELEGVYQAVEQIAHLARLKNKLLKAKGDRELAEVRAEIATSIRDNVKARPRTHEPRSFEEKRKAFFEGLFASHRKIASFARELDGFADGGPMWEHVIRPLNEAGNREATMNAEATSGLLALFDRHYQPSERAGLYRKQWIEALGPRDNPLAALSHQARLMVALNWGNETNRQRVMAGKQWTEPQVQAILDTLDRRDWAFVQDVWDFYEGYWTQIAEKQRRVTGLAPPKVEAVPVFTRFGERRGGYHPLMYEGQLSGRVFNLEEASAADMQKAAAYVHATTQRGHTKERVEGAVTLPVRLDFGVIFEHTSRVIHDLTHHEALIDVGRVIGSDEVQAAVYDTLGSKAFDQFRRALKDIAVGDTPAQHEVEGFMAHLRSGATIVGLGWSVTTAALQPLGLTQSIKRIGVRYVVRGLSKWFRGAVHMEGVVAGIQAKSEFMANRARTQMREVNEIRNRIGVDTGRWTGAADTFLRGVTADKVTKQGMLDSYFYLIAKLQLVADVPTWLGAYEKATSEGVEEATAVALADQAVLDSQGGGQIKDLAAVQRGSPAWKMWTNFYSFFNVTYNLWSESYRGAKRNLDAVAMGRLAVDYLLLFAGPAVLGHLVRAALRGELGEELEDPDALGLALAGETAAFMAGSMVGLRELGGFLQGYAGYEGPAGARGIASASRLLTQVGQMEADEAFWRALNATGGALFHYPAAQVERTFRGIKALVEGQTTNPMAPLVGPGRKR